MTNLKDLLNDFAEDVKKDLEEIESIKPSERSSIQNFEYKKNERIDEYLQIIKKRLIGE